MHTDRSDGGREAPSASASHQCEARKVACHGQQQGRGDVADLEAVAHAIVPADWKDAVPPSAV